MAISSLTYPSIIVIIIIKEYLDLDIDNIFIKEILKLNVTTLLSTYTLNRIMLIIIKTMQTSKVLNSRS